MRVELNKEELSWDLDSLERWNQTPMIYTVEPALVTTCLQRPHFLIPLEVFLSLKHNLKEPVYNGHFFMFPLGGRYRQV